MLTPVPKGAEFLAAGKSHMGRASGRGTTCGTYVSAGYPTYQRRWPQSWWQPPLSHQTGALGRRGNLDALSPPPCPKANEQFHSSVKIGFQPRCL